MEKLVVSLEHLLELRKDREPTEEEWRPLHAPGKISATHGMGMAQRSRGGRRVPGKGSLTTMLAQQLYTPMALAMRQEPGGERPARRSVEEIAGELASDPGKPLDAATQARFERVFGHSFAHVRVHDSDRAAAAAAELGAEAFALGSDIYFARGMYAPGTRAGDRILAHELTHVVQSDQGRLSRPDDESGVAERDDSAELEAYSNEDRLLGYLVGAGMGGPRRGARPAGVAPGVAGANTHGPAQVAGGEAIMRREGDPPGTTGNTQSDPNATDPAQREPTEEEIQQMIADAQQQGGSQPTPEVQPEEPVNEAPQENVEPVQGSEPAPNADAAGGEGAQPAQLASVPPGPGGSLQAFEALKSGPLANWDEEVAWHDYFNNPGGSATEGIQLDRNALIMDALASGGLAGFQAGVKSLAIDTLINVASTKIPYLQGFVEMARIAYDPAAWFEGQSQATVGKIANGLDQLWNGNWVDKLEGLVNVMDGLNGFIGLASTICWIVAAAGFVISFICPAVLPFVALCANWAVTLGTISTVIGVYITLARLGVMAARAAQIKWGEANPAELLAQSERLRAQTQSFTQEFTVRAGDNLRQRGQQALQNRHAAQSSPQATARTNRSTGTQPSRMQRIRNALSGGAGFVRDTASAGLGLQRARGGVGEIRDNARTMGQVTRAYRGTGEYASPGGNRTTRQQLADMEHAGATVYYSDNQRRRVDQQLEEQGQGRPINREHAQLEAQRAQRQAEYDEAVRQHQEALQRAQRAREDVEAARQNLQQARQEHGDTVAAAQTHVQRQQALHNEATSALERARYVRDVVKGLEQDAIASGDPIRISVARQHVHEHEIRVLDAERRVIDTNYNLTMAQVDLTQARQPIVGAESRLQGAEQNVPIRDQETQTAATNRGTAHTDLNSAKVDVNLHNLPGGQTREQAERQANAQRGYRVITDFTGSGTSYLRGHNQGAGRTGAGTSLVGEIFDGVARQEAQAASGGPVYGGPLGSWSRTGEVMNDPNAHMDLIGTAGGRGPGQDYAGQLQARYDQLRGELPAPPLDAPNQVDGASQAFSAIDEEERQIRFQQEVITGLMEEGNQSITALDAVQAISAANQEALATHEGELTTRLTAQDGLEQAGNDINSNAQESQAKGSEGQGLVGGFVGRFIELMGMVPSRLVSNAGEATSGAQRLDQGVRDQGQSARETAEGGQVTVQEAQRMRTETTGAQQNAQTVGQELQGLDQGISEQQLAATDGLTFMQDAMTTSQERLDAIAAEKERLSGEHSAAVGSMTAWITSHQQIRTQGLGDLDGLVELVEQSGNAQQ